MTNEEIVKDLQHLTDKAKRNEARIVKLEEKTELLHKIATATEVMAEQLKRMDGSITGLAVKVDKLEAKPGKRWDTIVDKAVWAVLAAVIAYMMGRFF